MAAPACLIFSRDRPLQLHALLESVVEYAPDLFDSIVVLYRPTSPMQALGYLECGRAFDGVEFWRESPSFEADVREWLGGAGELISFLVDDDLFFKHTVNQQRPWPDEVAYSLRLPMDGEEPRWRWKNAPGDLGYPLALDGHVFRRELIEALLHKLRFDDPTRLEAGLAARVHEVEHLPYMSGWRSLVGVPANRVSPTSGMPFDTRGGQGGPWSPEALCTAYLDGTRLDRAAMQADLEAATDAHWPAELRFSHS